MTFFSTTAGKRLVIDLLRAICKQTTNTLDDRAVDLLRSICQQTTNTLDDKAVDMLEQQLFPKLN